MAILDAGVNLAGEQVDPGEQATLGLEGNCDARGGATLGECLVTPTCSWRSSVVSSGVIFFSGCRSIPGTVPAINQLDWLSSMTATRVAFSSKETRDLPRSLACDIRHSDWQSSLRQ
jgi:hypothetical protein